MKIIEIKKIENCLEGKNVRELFFDRNLTSHFIAHLGQHGKVIIHEFKPKPFFTIIFRGKFTIKGSFGNNHARLILPDDSGDKYIDEIISKVSGF